jgi:hypothetical protein
MARSRFPRVSPRTRRRLPKAPKLPPLQWAIYNASGVLVRVEELPDPRAQICASFNSHGTMHAQGFVAVPIEGDAPTVSDFANGRKAGAQ